MFELAWPWALLLLPLPILAIILLKPSLSQEAALYTPFYRDIASINKHSNATNTLKLWQKLLAIVCWFCLVLAASQPQWVDEMISLPISGRDLMLAVDISGSMEEIDLSTKLNTVTRLDVVKDVLNKFIERRQGDRIGLVLFGSQAYLQTPLTFDSTTVNTLLNEAQIGMAGRKTAIGDAIGLTIKRLQNIKNNQRVIILLTDGANTAGNLNPIQATRLAQQENVKIYTIGVGADEMIKPGLFGTNFGARKVNPSRDLDEETLTKIAELTNGRYFRAHNKNELEDIYQLLDELEPVEHEEEFFKPKKSLYYWPLGIGLLISFLLLFFSRFAKH